MPYQRFQPLKSPAWLQGTNGEPFQGELGRAKDAMLDRIRQAILTWFPGAAPADALAHIGADRQLPVSEGETDADYANRLIAAWDAWPFAGSHFGVLTALYLAGFPIDTDGTTIVQFNGRYAQLDGSAELTLGDLMECIHRVNLDDTMTSPYGWLFDASHTFYSQFGIVFPEDIADLDNSPDNPKKRLLNAIVELWRPAKGLYRGAWVIRSGMTLGWPTGRTLGGDPDLGGNDVEHIEP